MSNFQNNMSNFQTSAAIPLLCFYSSLWVLALLLSASLREMFSSLLFHSPKPCAAPLRTCLLSGLSSWASWMRRLVESSTSAQGLEAFTAPSEVRRFLCFLYICFLLFFLSVASFIEFFLLLFQLLLIFTGSIYDCISCFFGDLCVVFLSVTEQY